MLAKQEKKRKRHKSIRAKIKGQAKRPRLCVFRSNNHIYAQLIDDDNGKTLIAVKDTELEKKLKNNIEIAKAVGVLLSRKAQDKNIKEVIFDRGGYKYHGRVKALAEGAREGGLKF